MDDLLEVFGEIHNRGCIDVECTEDCGESATVEPDGDYPCHTEGCTGRLVSPLILEGLI